MLSGVSKTALVTLRARADEHARPDRFLVDPLAAEWFSRVTWPPELDRWYGPNAQYQNALRADDIDHILRRYADEYVLHTIVELGAGLSTRRQRLGGLTPAVFERFIEIDLPEVIALRSEWGAGGEPIAASALDYAWMDGLPGEPGTQVFVIEGLLYYLPRPDVDALLAELTRRFPGSVILMDVLGRNDYTRVLEDTSAVGAAIAWRYEGDFEDVLDGFGLDEVPGFEPARLMNDMFTRYWHRFDAKQRGAIYWSRHTPGVWAGRSGIVLGRLKCP